MEAKIIAGNFKSNKTMNETAAYLGALDSALGKNSVVAKNAESNKNSTQRGSILDEKSGLCSCERENRTNGSLTKRAANLPDLSPKDNAPQIYIFPSICAMCENNFKNLTLGAQNAHFAESGAFTGEATLSHLRDFKIETLLIGHSERRNIFGESDEIVAQKFNFFAENNLQIFLCVGENLAVRKRDKTKDFLRSQLEKINLDYNRLIIAYEPIWAIGTGENASLAQISEVYEFLSELTKKQIIYGGSVNERNAGEILQITDGVLVGNASLEVEKFYQIINGGKQ